MNRRTSVFLHSPEIERYHYPPECPFRTDRAGRLRQRLIEMGLLHGVHRSEMPPVPATRQELERYHSSRYLDVLIAAEKGHLDEESLRMGLGTPDCPVFPGMYEYASLAAGASLLGARLILQEKAHVVFNPSGGFHHAHPERAAGFCYVNDGVLAAMALAEAGCRVLFLDLDVHHCDGVQEAFYRRRDVMTVSLHESGRTLFPGTGFEQEIGEAEGRGFTVNLPLPVGTYDAAYLRAFREAALPVILAFQPKVVIVELGMDALAGDPLAHLHLTNNVHAEILQTVLDLGCPILALGGGGYHVERTVRGWALAWTVLCGEQTAVDELTLGLGGVLMETPEWAGGLRDRVLLSDAGIRDEVDREIDRVIGYVRRVIFPLHGLTST